MTASPQRMRRLIFAAVVAGFALLVVAAAAVAIQIQRTGTLGELVAHTYEVEKARADLQLYVERTEVGRRSFLIRPAPFFRDVFERNSALVEDATAQARTLTSDNPRQQERLDRIAALWSEHTAVMRASIDERAVGGSANTAAASFGDADIAKVRELREVARAMVATERTLLAERSGELQTAQNVSYASLMVAGIILVALATIVILSTRRSFDALAQTGGRLRVLNEDLEAAVSERTRELRQANEEIQRFAYIVSHDLRSPLVNVMGFTAELDAATLPLSDMIRRAETEAPHLVTEDARVAVEEDLPEAIGFIRSSTQKMDRLINAILRLSREGRRVLTPEPLDMNALVAGIVDSMQHRLGETGALITVERLPGLTSDRVATEQIMSNLIENSVKYLKPDRPGRVHVTGGRRADRVFYDVADNGRGIDPKDHQRIFDLFRRSGAQDQPGEGIGLAHVRALAYRLGGIVECHSSLGDGATFRVSLPSSLRPEAVAS